MKKQLSKLVFGKPDLIVSDTAQIVPHFKKISDVWHNSNYQDFGIERIFRLFLVTSQIFFPGIYIEYFNRKASFHNRKITGEVYVIFKTVMPFAMLYFSLWDHGWLYVINIYLLIETYVYIFHKIFLPEHNRGKTHNRSLILLFFNFTEVIASFGVIYAAGNYLNLPISNWIDALYFSLITGATIGYGDIYPVTSTGKLLVLLQIVSTLSFLILFFNFFAPRALDAKDKTPDI